ncbi:MAG: TetR/AcrR family transcriptional regulator [Marinifilaceae bacterium]|jgi:TetR/AcrR family transcriptional regulator of autoinduction and epiphytic fitness|nr:TetR/AcrR family transcriptional regulator [Marinifilaceae bacterium]
MARKERDTSKKRKEIIKAAINTFEKVGFNEATMDQIAKEAGAVKKTLYNHFETKDKLLEVIVEECISSSQQTSLFKYNPEQPIDIQLVEIIKLRTQNFTDENRLKSMRVLFNAYTKNRDLIKSIYSNYDSPEENFIENWMKDAINDNKLDVSDIKLASQMFWSLIFGSIIWPRLVDDNLFTIDIDCIINEIIAIFLNQYGVK